MTPVTGPYITPFPYIATRSPAGLRVAYRQKDWPVEPAGDAERFVAPRVPIYRVVRVLKQVWGFLVDQAVGEFVLTTFDFHFEPIPLWIIFPLLYTDITQSIDLKRNSLCPYSIPIAP